MKVWSTRSMPSMRPGSNKKIALLIAVIALCPALSETLGKGAQTEIDQQECRGLQPLGLLPGQEHPPHHGAGRGRAGQAEPCHRPRRGGQGSAAEADRRLAEDRGALPPEPDTGEGSSNWPSAPSTPSTSATRRPQNITTSSWPRPPSRSPSCWRPRPSSPALSRWPGCPAS